MKYLWTTLYVKDLEKALSFYRDFLGLPLNRRMEGAMKMAFLGAGDTEIELIEGEAKEAHSISLGFEVRGLEALHATLKDRYVLSDIIRPNAHVGFFFLNDPDGYRIQLVERKA